MTNHGGTIAIMGSGETTDSMVRVHRYLLDQLPRPVKAVFIDTPAGFQMNADDLYDKAKEYFEKRLNQPMDRASFRSAKDISLYDAEKTFETLRQADYIFVGPGSPTYALKNWAGTPISEIIFARIQSGGIFVAASAAALTLGRFTLPVYEIYKVGGDLHWVEGLDLLGRFGLNMVVIPHWNNAEGGTHDTRFCYMGESRLLRLETMLPPEVPLLGIDEHTACILDFQSGRVLIKGVSGVTLRHRGMQRTFQDGQALLLEELKGFTGPQAEIKAPSTPSIITTPPIPESFLEQVKTLQESFVAHLKNHHGPGLVEILVNLDKLIWKSCKEFEEEDFIAQAREVLRGMIVQLGLKYDETPKDLVSILAPALEILLDIRGRLRAAQQWNMADEIRDRLNQIGIIVEDTPQGPRWRLKEKSIEHRAEGRE